MATQNVSDDEQKLFDAATKVRANSYAPFSQYYVGAAIIDENGALHIGCNVENSSFPEGACAEANAVGAMIAAGGNELWQLQQSVVTMIWKHARHAAAVDNVFLSLAMKTRASS